MARILIVEDEPIIADDLSYQLTDLNHKVVQIEHTYADGLKAIRENDYDLILLDINLNDTGDGIELAALARKLHNKPIIFMTSHSDVNTIQRAKLVEPEAYIIKPIDEKDLRINISLALFRHSNIVLDEPEELTDTSNDIFFIRSNKGLTKIQSKQIIYIESMDNYAKIHTDTKRFVVSKTLKHVYEQLNQEQFIRIHKKYVINFTHLQGVEDGQAKLTTQTLPIGRSYKKNFIESIKTLS